MAGRVDQRLRGRAAAALALAGSLLLSGCGLLSGPQALSEDAPLTIQVSSPVVSSRNILPEGYTCYGAGESPPVTWSGAPARTKSSVIGLTAPNQARSRPLPVQSQTAWQKGAFCRC